VKPLCVHHVAIHAADAGRSIAFYTDVLGGTIRDDRPDFPFAGAWIDVGATQVHVVEAEVPLDRGQHFALLVDDLDAAVAELRARGIDVGEPKVVGPDRQTFLNDPDGNRIELHALGHG
jgi:catechol 2,3-dioxygenase-like lactoylglutathione lyase family enzyme